MSRGSPSSIVSLYDELSQASADDVEQGHNGNPGGMECKPEDPMGGENPATHMEWRQGNPNDTYSLSNIDSYPYLSVSLQKEPMSLLLHL